MRIYPKLRWLKQLEQVSSYVASGIRLRRSQSLSTLHLFMSTWSCTPICKTSHGMTIHSIPRPLRWSSSLQAPIEYSGDSRGDVTAFLQSCSGELQGPNHCWLNIEKQNNELILRGKTILFLVGDFLADDGICAMLENTKLLQQRFPRLCVAGFHTGGFDNSPTVKADLTELVMEEFITFPILLSRTKFNELHTELQYVLCKDFKHYYIYKEKDLVEEMLDKAIEDLKIQECGNSDCKNEIAPKFKCAWYKPVEEIKEPPLCSPLQSLLLNVSGAVSADEYGQRLFISDSNHHRILVTDESGHILDCIGSSPGFADGEFAHAKFLRPGSTFYEDASDCLYIVDSENHAIRKADMNKRVVETFFPNNDDKKSSGLLSRIMEKLKFRSSIDKVPKQINDQPLIFPWHLLRSEENDILVINRSFQKLWVLDAVSGEIKECVNGHTEILKTYDNLFKEKMSLLNWLPTGLLNSQTRSHPSNNLLPYASLLSSITTFDEHLVMFLSGLLKINTQSGEVSKINLSNVAFLGLPYWQSLPLERYYFSAELFERRHNHIEHCHVLPGRVSVQLNLAIPIDTELVDPLQEEHIWCQSRGSATVFNRAADIKDTIEKAGIAQQWYDELDKLTFATSEIDSSSQNDLNYSLVECQDGILRIGCVSNASPGTCEIYISVPLYLKLRAPSKGGREAAAARLVELMDCSGGGEGARDFCVQFLVKSGGDLREVVFSKPIHVKVKLKCDDYPKGESFKELVLNDTTLQINLSL